MTDETEVIEQEIAQDESSIEEEAKAQGWTSKEDYVASGRDPSTWRSASEFIEYGKNSQYILRKNLEKEKEETKKLHDTIMQMYTTMQTMNERSAEREAKAAEKAREETLREIHAAQAQGDFNTYNKKLLELADIEQEKLKNEEKKKETPAPQNVDPEIMKWLENPTNRWYHDDPELNTQATLHYANLEKKYPNITTKQRLEMTEKFVIDQNPDKFEVKKKPFTSVEGGSGVSSRGGGKTFNDIPTDDRNAMEKMAKALSFYGKKDKESMQKYEDYKKACVETYFGKKG